MHTYWSIFYHFSEYFCILFPLHICMIFIISLVHNIPVSSYKLKCFRRSRGGFKIFQPIVIRIKYLFILNSTRGEPLKHLS